MKQTNITNKYSKKIIYSLRSYISLICELENKSGFGRSQNMSDLCSVVLNLTVEFMSIDSENSLFKLVDVGHIPNLIERS